MTQAESAIDIAQRWLALVDAQDWNGSWREAAAALRGALTADQWAAQVGPIRAQLGPVTSRALAVDQPTNMLPGAPPGQYDVLQIHSVFGSISAVTEVVTLVRENDGEWRVGGYFIH